jgi:hypothetical protein
MVDMAVGTSAKRSEVRLGIDIEVDNIDFGDIDITRVSRQVRCVRNRV